MEIAPKRTLEVALVVVILLVAGCGDGEGENTTTTTAASPTETVAAVTITTGAGSDDPPDLSGEYMVTHFASPSFNSATNLWPGSEITLILGGDGTISGNAGCNNYNGTYEVSGPYVSEPGLNEEEGQAFTVTGLSWTEMACEDDLIMEQETEYLDALQNVDYWMFGQGFGDDPDALLLRSLEDGLQVQASTSG